MNTIPLSSSTSSFNSPYSTLYPEAGVPTLHQHDSQSHNYCQTGTRAQCLYAPNAYYNGIYWRPEAVCPYVPTVHQNDYSLTMQGLYCYAPIGYHQTSNSNCRINSPISTPDASQYHDPGVTACSSSQHPQPQFLPPHKLYTSMPVMYQHTVTQTQPRSSYENPVHQTQEPIFQPPSTVIGPEGKAFLGMFLF